jgi:hypothetical protein
MVVIFFFVKKRGEVGGFCLFGLWVRACGFVGERLRFRSWSLGWLG